MTYAIKQSQIKNYIDINVQNLNPLDVEILRKISDQTQGKLSLAKFKTSNLIIFNFKGFILGDLRVLYQKAVAEPSEDYKDFHLDESQFTKQLVAIKKCFSDSIGTPEIPKVYWDDIGGLANLKNEIQNSIGLPLKYSHLIMNKNLKRSGILLFGPPGKDKNFFYSTEF